MKLQEGLSSCDAVRSTWLQKLSSDVIPATILELTTFVSDCIRLQRGKVLYVGGISNKKVNVLRDQISNQDESIEINKYHDAMKMKMIMYMENCVYPSHVTFEGFFVKQKSENSSFSSFSSIQHPSFQFPYRWKDSWFICKLSLNHLWECENKIDVWKCV